jgi:hypothetical protein
VQENDVTSSSEQLEWSVKGSMITELVDGWMAFPTI